MPSDSGANAPFAQAMAAMMGQAKSASDEFTRMFADLKMPAVPDSEALLVAHKRNIEALTQFNRVAMEGAQAVAKRHMEIVQQTMAEMGDTMRALTSTDAPATDRAAHHAELLKAAYERAVAHAKELAEMIQHANGEALSLLNRRFVEAVDEVKALVDQGAKVGQSTVAGAGAGAGAGTHIKP